MSHTNTDWRKVKFKLDKSPRIQKNFNKGENEDVHFLKPEYAVTFEHNGTEHYLPVLSMAKGGRDSLRAFRNMQKDNDEAMTRTVKAILSKSSELVRYKQN
jgi:hypothetical protein